MAIRRLNKGNVGDLIDTATVRQVIGTDVELHVRNSGVDYSVILQGIPSDNIADGDTLRLPFVVECIGVKQFKTVTGATRSLYVIRKFPYMDKIKEWEQIRTAEWEKNQARKAPATAK